MDRAYDKLTEKVVAIFEIVIDDTGSISLINDRHASRFILLRSSGLHDHHGSELREGDILSSKTDKLGSDGYYIAGTYDHHPENAKVVRFENGSFYLDTGTLYDAIVWSPSLELIGNIYEDSHLLPDDNPWRYNE